MTTLSLLLKWALTISENKQEGYIIMKKIFKLDGLCCAACAAKIENGISKLKGVENVSLNFITTKLIIEASESDIENIANASFQIIRKYEPKVKITPLHR